MDRLHNYWITVINRVWIMTPLKSESVTNNYLCPNKEKLQMRTWYCNEDQMRTIWQKRSSWGPRSSMRTSTAAVGIGSRMEEPGLEGRNQELEGEVRSWREDQELERGIRSWKEKSGAGRRNQELERRYQEPKRNNRSRKPPLSQAPCNQ